MGKSPEQSDPGNRILAEAQNLRHVADEELGEGTNLVLDVEFDSDVKDQVRDAMGLTLALGPEIIKQMTPEERARLLEFSKLTDPRASAFGGAMPERVFRPSNARVAHRQMAEVVSSLGLSDRFPLADRVKMQLAKAAGVLAPGPVMEQVKNEVVRRVGGFVEVFPSATSADAIVRHLLEESRETGIGHQINLVTEAAKTSDEAKRNIGWYKDAIRGGAAALAIKPTAIVAMSNAPVATKSSSKKLAEALTDIFSQADLCRLADGRTCEISIDSEESGLVDMVTDALIDAAQYVPNVRVKNAIQSYLRDAEKRQLNPLIETSITRVRDQKGAPLGARLVKGANLPGEIANAYKNGWLDKDGKPMIPLTESKIATDANYMRLLNVMKDVVKEGHFTMTMASMNWFTTMDNLVFCARAGLMASECQGRVSLAMLRGMGGQPVYRHIMKKFGIKPGMMEEYTPVITFDYLVELFKYYLRRLDELIGKDPKFKTRNFLGDMADAAADYGNPFNSPSFLLSQIRNGHLAAVLHYQRNLKDRPYDPAIPSFRGRDEEGNPNEPLVLPESIRGFKPVPKANFGSRADRRWGEEVLDSSKRRDAAYCSEHGVEHISPTKIHLNWPAPDGVNRRRVQISGPARRGVDIADIEYPGQIERRVQMGAMIEVCPDIDSAIDVARNSPIAQAWSVNALDIKLGVMRRVVSNMRNNRSELVQALVDNIDKALGEADGEVCEAMDFVNLARLHRKDLLKRKNLNISFNKAAQLALVICPKNFPQAIPVAAIVTRLLAGYRVIVKPSGGEDEETVLATYEMMKCFWEAGVPKEALVFMPCDNKQAAYLSRQVDYINFVGGTETARAIRRANPSVEMLAETGGNNVMVIDSTGDLKKAALLVAQSLCGFAGQKCSAVRAVICTSDVDFEEFKRLFVGMLKEMLVAGARTMHSDVTHLSKEPRPGEALYEKINNCMPGEEWLWRSDKHPGFGVREIKDPGEFDFTKLEEIFAAICTLIQIPGGVKDAVGMVNGLPANLTGGLISENREMIEYARRNWQTGVLYFNDTITGCEAHCHFGNGVGASNEGLIGASTGSYEWVLLNAHVTRAKNDVIHEGGEAKVLRQYAPYERVKKDKSGLKHMLESLERQFELGEEHFAALSEKLNNPLGDAIYLIQDVKDAMEAGWSYLYEKERYFSKARKVPYQVLGKDGLPIQDDWVESRPAGPVIYRVSPYDSPFEIMAKTFAAVAAGNRLRLSVDTKAKKRFDALVHILGLKFHEMLKGVEIHYEDDEEFAALISQNRYSHVYYARKEVIPGKIFQATADAGMAIDFRPASGDGLNDLITQHRQQSFTWIYHTAGDAGYETERRKRMSPEQREKELPQDIPFIPETKPGNFR